MSTIEILLLSLVLMLYIAIGIMVAAKLRGEDLKEYLSYIIGILWPLLLPVELLLSIIMEIVEKVGRRDDE